jgi:alpha-mannosidase
METKMKPNLMSALLLCGTVMLGFATTGGAAEKASAPAQLQAGKPEPAARTCLLLVGSCLANGGNSYLYQQFSNAKLKVQAGDVLQYEVFLAGSNPNPKGGLDIEGGGISLRDSGTNDANGLRTHGDALLEQARNHWLTRRIPLEKLAGREMGAWSMVFEGDDPGVYVQYLDNVVVIHPDQTQTVIYGGGPAAANATHLRNGYSARVLLQTVPRQEIVAGPALDRMVAKMRERQELLLGAGRLENGLEVADWIAKEQGAEAGPYTALIAKSRQELVALQAREPISPAEFNAELKRIAADLEPLGKLTKQYTGHLVGHGHIDAQWLWEWPETVAEFGKTFGQACKFMEEFPGFTFSQSSTAFYQATEFHHPELFAKIQKYVKEGRWELVGGQTVETDLNFVGSESQAMHFLYGQRFFRERFEGRQAVVAFMPDTFGHNAQMPQIVRLGGCRYYYFCRAGKDLPLFWWEGMDGTRVLAFQEVNSWYNSELTPAQFKEMLDFQKRTGSKDMLWVYGVGNHGGGPTRESINVAVDWMKQPYLPTVKFSTATDFFQTAEKQLDPARMPVVKGELNTIFEGCYTTHGDIKRMNDDAQVAAETAEALAAIAARHGFAYPGTQLRINWEDILWNHHHDTIDGSAINAPYRKSQEVYGRATASCRQIANDALAFLAARIQAPAGALVVFNPTGVERNMPIECARPGNGATRMAAGAETAAIQALGDGTRGLFIARRLPPYGYRVYQPKQGETPPAAVTVSGDGTILENANLKVTIDATTGRIASLLDKRTQRQLIRAGGSGNRLEIHWERFNDMSAWSFGPIDHVESLDSPVTLKVVETGPARVAVEFTRKWRENLITQRVALTTGGDMVDCRLSVDWKETGDRNKLSPCLRLAFDLDLKDPQATYDIPYGSVARPADGHEVPMLKWADVSGAGQGFSLINDCKHGLSFKDGTLRWSLIRTPCNPDNHSDCYLQTINYALYPHAGDWRQARTDAHGIAFLHPVLTAIMPATTTGTLPAEGSFVSSAAANVLITAVKRAEDDNDLVVRCYESQGRPTAAALTAFWPVQKVQSVNFIEDPQPEAGETVAPDGRTVKATLRGYEIRTLKLQLQPVPGTTQSGTRGGGPPRAF